MNQESSTIRLKRASRDTIDSWAIRGELLRGEPLFITDEERLAISVDANNYVAFLKESESGGGGGLTVVNISTDTNAASGTHYIATASLVLTLPASPSIGDSVGFSNMSGTITCSIARNGSNILGLSQDLTVNRKYISFVLTYSDVSNGWVFT